MPEDALYGIQTLRALENFPITGIALREFPGLIEALAAVKEAAATANAELGLLDAATADPIKRAAQEIRAGRHHEARHTLATLERLRSTQFVTAYGMALIHTGLGQVDNTII